MVALNQNTKQQERAEDIIRRRDKIKSERGTWDSHAQEVAEYVVPRKSYVTVRRQEGQKTITFNTELYDPTQVFANQNQAAGLISHLAPPNSRWFMVKMKNEELNESEAVKVALAKLSTILHEEFAASNFYMQLNELMIDMGWAGMACMEPKAGRDTALNFKTHHISEFYIAENSDQKVDTVYYTFEYTARQALQEWGEKAKLSKCIKDALESTKKEEIDKKFEFVQELRPREEYDSIPAVGTRRKIASTFVAVKDKVIIDEDGFFEMPKLTPRWTKNSNEVNGRSQGMFALPWIKQLNTVSKDVTQARSLGLRPPILTPDDGFIGAIRSVPGAIWHYRKGYAQNANAIRTLPVNGDTKGALDEKKWLVENIQKAFYNDLFVMLAQQTKTQTAFEIAERIEEKHTMIVPPIGRLQSELFNGVVTRSIGVLGRSGRLQGILPPELIDQEYEIQYISKLALALRILEVRSISATMEAVEQMGVRNPQIYDNFNDDKTTRGIAERFGMPPDMMHTIPEREDIREQRQAELEAQQAMEMALEAGKVIPPSKEVEEGSPLAAMAEAVG